MAERWGVPQPSPEAKLTIIWDSQSEKMGSYALGFVDPAKPGYLMLGFDNRAINSAFNMEEVENLDQISVSNVTSRSQLFFNEVYPVNLCLITGIQLLGRGDTQLGVALIDKAVGLTAEDQPSALQAVAGSLARSCLSATMNEITTPHPDFREIKKSMETLVADQPELKTKQLESLLESLQAAVEHKTSPEGSIERTIDDFLLCGRTQGRRSFNFELQPAERTLILKGFEAIPTLIKQLESRRSTNHLMQGFNNFSSFPMNSGQVIDGYLHRFANNDFDSDWLLRQKGYTSSKNAILDWWTEASAMGEEAYVRKYCIVVDQENVASISNELLLLAEVRYPTLLPELSRKILGTSTPSWPVYNAIVKNDSLTQVQKITLLEEGIATNHPSHRNSALGSLQAVDSNLADRHLLNLLKQSPSTAENEYWNDQDANLGTHVSNSRDPEVWQEFHTLLDRADLGMRLELINNLRPPMDAPPRVLRSFHEIYLRFRDDVTVRDESTSKKYSGPGAGFPHARISMRDFVHQHWAWWLDLELKSPQRNASPAEWKTYRDRVGLAVIQHATKLNH